MFRSALILRSLTVMQAVAQTGPSIFDSHDTNATLLSLMSIDNERLTYLYQGRDQSLTDVHGQNEVTARLLG